MLISTQMQNPKNNRRAQAGPAKRNADSRRPRHAMEEARAQADGILIESLAQAFPRKSRTLIKQLLAKKAVAVDGSVVTRHDHPVSAGQLIAIGDHPKRVYRPGADFNILYEDDELLVVDKRAGLLAVATGADRAKTAHGMAQAYLRQSDPKARLAVVHRMDRETSGVLVFAKTDTAKVSLDANADQITRSRLYTAVVEGVVEDDDDRLVSYLRPVADRLMASSSSPAHGTRAVTRYRVLDRSPRLTMLEVSVETSIRHQVRVHMDAIGHPIAGDTKYGARAGGPRRVCLHARSLCLMHPATGQIMEFVSPVPRSITEYFKASKMAGDRD